MTDILDIFASDLRPMEFWAHQAQQKLATWTSGVPEGYSTGFADLDKYTRLVPSELTVVAARPSQGKTTLVMQMAETVANQLREDGDPGVVAVFSAEMAGWSLVVRMASALCGVNAHALRNGKGTPEEFDRMKGALTGLRNLPIWIDDNTGPTTGQMLEQLTRLNETNPIRMMVFDFVELGGDRAKQEDLRIGAIAQNLKGIAKTLQIPVVALSQLNRGVEDRANKMPTLSDLRYSGMLEQLADSVVFIMRPEYYIERAQEIQVAQEDRKGVAYIQIAKNRNGPVGLVKLSFTAGLSRFGNLQRPASVPTANRRDFDN